MLYWLLLGVLAVWRVTHFLNAEEGPWNMVTRVRDLAGEGIIGSILDCFYCLSVWVAAPVALWLGNAWGERVLLWLSLSAGAILLERITGSGIGLPLASIVKEQTEKEKEDVLLQPGQNTSQAKGDSRDAESRARSGDPGTDPASRG
jgi:hypothetical protein